MYLIKAKNMTIDYPIFDSSGRSLKKTLVRAATGGKIASDAHGVCVRALDDVSFTVAEGERVALMGHNGAGKSTLLRALAGVYAPTGGALMVKGSVSSLLDLSLGMDGEFTGYENIFMRCIFMGISRQEVKKRIDDIIEFSGLGDYITMPMRTYSSGMSLRLAFSVCTAFPSDIVLMDEWLAIGDSEFSKKADEKTPRIYTEIISACSGFAFGKAGAENMQSCHIDGPWAHIWRTCPGRHRTVFIALNIFGKNPPCKEPDRILDYIGNFLLMNEIKIGKKAKIGVIIVNYNGGEMLARCIDGLMRQEFKDFIALIIDNDSKDNSLVRISERFPDVIIVQAGSNRGFAGANNIAFRLLNNNVEWFALLNPDACPSPDWLAALDSATKKHVGFDSFGSRCYSDGEMRLLDGLGDEYHISGLAWRHAYGHPDGTVYNSEREIFSPCAAAALYSRTAVKEAGGFDEDFFCYLEDVDLGFRLRMLGYRSMYIPDAKVIHKGSSISGLKSDFQVYHGHRNIVWTYFKNMPLLPLLLFLPLHIAMNICSILKYSLEGRISIILRAKSDSLRGLGNILGKRRPIQSSRRISISALLRIFNWKLSRS